MKNLATFYFYWYVEWKWAYLQIWAESRYDESWRKVDWHRMWCISSRSGSRRWWSNWLRRVLFPNGLCQQKIAMSGSIKRTCFIRFSLFNWRLDIIEYDTRLESRLKTQTVIQRISFDIMWFIYDAMFLIKVFDKNEINPIWREESLNSYLLYYKIKDEIIVLPSSKTITFYMMSQVLMENHYTNISFIILRRFIVELTCWFQILIWYPCRRYESIFEDRSRFYYNKKNKLSFWLLKFSFAGIICYLKKIEWFKKVLNVHRL